MIKETTFLHVRRSNLNLDRSPIHVEGSKFKPSDNVEVKELSRPDGRRRLSSWNPDVQVLDLTATDPDLKGFSGGFESGDYGYFTPYRNDVSTISANTTIFSSSNKIGFSGKVARVNLANFSQVQVLDLTDTDPALRLERWCVDPS